MSYETTPKGDAFVRYYFIDRGSEEDLSLSQAQADFEKYIYNPIRLYVVQDVVTRVAEEAMDDVIPEDKPIEDVGEDDMLEVAQYIGMGFLAAYRDLHSPESD